MHLLPQSLTAVDLGGTGTSRVGVLAPAPAVTAVELNWEGQHSVGLTCLHLPQQTVASVELGGTAPSRSDVLAPTAVVTAVELGGTASGTLRTGE